MPLYPPPTPLQTTTPADAQIGSAATGTSTQAARGDHVHSVLVSAVAPSNSAPGDVAAIGSAQGIPRRDHVHGRETVPLNSLANAVGPAVTDDSGDGYSVGSRWIDTTADKEYVLLDASVGAAVWAETTAIGDASAHIADAADAHDASAISFDDTGLGITAADVQTGLEQLDAAIAAGGIPATIFDAAGDIIVASAADTAARLAAGSEDDVLTIASGVPAWAAPTGGGVIIRGSVNANGTANEGSGFTVARTPAGGATGDYTITFTSAFAAAPIVVATAIGFADNDGSFTMLGARTTTTARVYMIANVPAGDRVDLAFTFIAMAV